MTWELMRVQRRLESNIEVAAESSGMRHCRSVYETVSGLWMAVTRLTPVGCSMGLLTERAEMSIVGLQEMLLVIGPERLLIDVVLLGQRRKTSSSKREERWTASCLILMPRRKKIKSG